MTTGILSILIKNEEEEILRDWLKREINPNIVLGNFLTQITNSVLAAVRLVEDGLDYQARVIFRNICEICWLTIVVISRKTIMNMYAQELNNKEEKNIWRKFLNSGKLIDYLYKIEKDMGIPELLLRELRNGRSETYKFYSQIVHNSYTTCMIGAYSKQIRKKDSILSNTFGMASKYSNQTLNKVNDCLFYFLGAFLPILINIHEFSVTSNRELWSIAHVLRESFIKYYVLLHRDH